MTVHAMTDAGPLSNATRAQQQHFGCTVRFMAYKIDFCFHRALVFQRRDRVIRALGICVVQLNFLLLSHCFLPRVPGE
jgi:hypothetical protein